MKSSRFIQNTDLATLKNRGKYTAEILIPQTFTTTNGVPKTTVVYSDIYVGTGKFEPYFIYEDENGAISTSRYKSGWIQATRRSYSTIDNQWHDNPDNYIYVQTSQAGAGIYRLEAYVDEFWAYTLYNATWTIDSPKRIKLYMHTFIDPFNQT